MNFLRKIFKKKAQVDPANDPNMVKAYDGYGREIFISKQQWKDKVLLKNLEEKRNNPNQLYDWLFLALKDGFVQDIVPYAEHLWRTDPIPSRGAAVLGIVYMKNNRLDEAERVLNDFLSAHGDNGVVLTNLAKVYDKRGDKAKAESILWHALEVDPNQENGLAWYIAIQSERGGEASVLDAYHHIAAWPKSWRVQLWLAREALARKDLPAAEAFYAEVFARAERPVPDYVLTQISGDLGKNGYLAEMFRLVEPHFDPAIHGFNVGNNLIMANRELGRTDIARRILNQLYAQKRPDWQHALKYWDTELAKDEVARKAQQNPGQSIVFISTEGPLWASKESPFAVLMPAKSGNTPQIAVLGSMALFSELSKKPVPQLSDAPGRISRIVALFLAEKIHLQTDAVGIALTPWAQKLGFAVFGNPYGDKDLCEVACKSVKVPHFIVAVNFDATQLKWKMILRLLRVSDCVRVAEEQIEADPLNPGPAIELLAQTLQQLLAKYAGVHITAHPQWYQNLSGPDLSDYLLRLEQQLAVICKNLDFLEGGGLFGEHEIIDGVLQLCLSQPASQLVRMVLAQTLRQMSKLHPELISEYKDKINLLQRTHLLTGEVGELINKAINQTMTRTA
ncbi:MAG: hypothetical protein HZA49_06445 [Planctomycetes bacterium]|nr:hypothetical protein [Planctomycetota bacterium]